MRRSLRPIPKDRQVKPNQSQIEGVGASHLRAKEEEGLGAFSRLFGDEGILELLNGRENLFQETTPMASQPKNHTEKSQSHFRVIFLYRKLWNDVLLGGLRVFHFYLPYPQTCK